MTTPAELRAQAAAMEARAVVLETPLTQANLDEMFAERRYDEIDQARRDGRLNNLLEGK